MSQHRMPRSHRWRRVIAGLAVAAAILAPTLTLVPVSSAATMEHEQPAPQTGRIGYQRTLHGVYAVSSPTAEDASLPDDQRFRLPRPLKHLLTRLVDRKATTPLPPVHDNPTVPGTSISMLTLNWENSENPTHEKIDTSSDSPLSLAARLDFHISGTRDHQPGEIQFTLPLTIFHDRTGKKDIGSVSMSLPEDPASGAEFTYERLADRIVVRNTQTLPADYEGYFELAYDHVTPHLLASGETSTPLQATMSVTGDKGQTAIKQSPPIDATVITHETLLSAQKQGTFYSSLPLGANMLPTGFDTSKYWYISWYVSAAIAGNRQFTLSVKDTPSGESKGTIVGTDIPGASRAANITTGENGNEILTVNNVFDGYAGSASGSSDNFFYHVIIAYPLSALPSNPKYTGSGATIIQREQNAITYTLTPKDGGTPQSKTGNGVEGYHRYPFNAVGDVFIVGKRGPLSSDDSGDENENDYAVDSGENSYALNELSSGKDFHTSWKVQSSQHVLNLTCRPGATDTSACGQKSVTTTVTDDGQWFDQQSSTELPLSATEAEVQSLDFHMPNMLDYTGNPTDGYQWVDSSKLPVPDTRISVYTGGKWVDVATVSATSSDRALTIAARNGATAKGLRLTLPAGTTQWKAVFTGNAPGEIWTCQENVVIHPAGRILERARKLLANSQDATTDLTNHVNMQIGSPDTTGATVKLGSFNRTASQRVGAAAQSAQMSKSGGVTFNDQAKTLVRIGYTLNASNMSNITNRSVLDNLVHRGILTNDTSGRFYDLLPLGVRADLSTVQARGGTLQGTRILENWKNSGRQMLVISLSGAPENTTVNGFVGFRRAVTFTAFYSYRDIKENGTTPRNVAAYVSDSPLLGTIRGSQSEPDTPEGGRNTFSRQAVSGVENLMTGLEPQNKGKISTLYASDEGTRINVLTYGLAGNWILTQSASQHSPAWGSTTTAYEGETYAYRLSAVGNGTDAQTHVILFDNIENQNPQFTGTFLRVDTASLKARGIQPVVWYSASTFPTSATPNLADGNWSTTQPEHVKAIAIDCSKKADGTDYTLTKNDALQAQIILRAPTGEGNVGKSASDRSWISSLAMGMPIWHPSNPASVRLAASTVTVAKNWDDGDNRDALRPSSITVHLQANGKNTATTTLNAGNKWTHTFTGLPVDDEQGNRIQYTASDTVSNYTTRSESVMAADGTSRITLTNTHTPATLTVSGTKTWDGTHQLPSSLLLGLYADGQDTGKRVSATVTGSRTWQWNFGTLPKNKNVGGKAVPIAYTVREDTIDNQEGTRSGWVPTASDGWEHRWAPGASIHNTWHPFGNLTLSKSATDTTDASKNKTFTFTLTLVRSDGSYDPATYQWTKTGGACAATLRDASCSGSVGNGRTVTLQAGQSVTVHEIAMGDKYTWQENPTDGFTTGQHNGLSGTIQPNTTVSATVNNVYKSTGQTFITATKTLDGRTLRPLQFAFTLSPVTGSRQGVGGSVGKTIRTTWNERDGSVGFSALSYTQADAGKVYWYEMRETPYNHPGYTSDNSVYRIKVEVNDRGDGTENPVPTYYSYKNATLTAVGGTPTFRNTYRASGSLTLAAQKIFVGGSLATQSFTFNLSLDGKPVRTASTNAAGVAQFKDLTYTQADAGKTYTYTVSEQKDDRPNVLWDTHTETVAVTVTDNGDGTLSLAESYARDGNPINLATSTPLVWTNQAGAGSLEVSKILATDSQTQLHKGTSFPMKVRLQPPAGAKLPATLPATYHDGTLNKNTPQTLHVSGGSVKINLKGGDWIDIHDIPGGTAYQVTEENQ